MLCILYSNIHLKGSTRWQNAIILTEENEGINQKNWYFTGNNNNRYNRSRTSKETKYFWKHTYTQLPGQNHCLTVRAREFFFSGCRLDLSWAFTGYGTLWGLYSLKSELIPLVFFSLYISRRDISGYVLRGGQTTQDCFLKGNCCFMAVEFISENYLQSKEYFLEWQEVSEFYQGRVCQFAK